MRVPANPENRANAPVTREGNDTRRLETRAARGNAKAQFGRFMAGIARGPSGRDAAAPSAPRKSKPEGAASGQTHAVKHAD